MNNVNRRYEIMSESLSGPSNTTAIPVGVAPQQLPQTAATRPLPPNWEMRVVISQFLKITNSTMVIGPQKRPSILCKSPNKINTMGGP
jgi:hypothetical protein